MEVIPVGGQEGVSFAKSLDEQQVGKAFLTESFTLSKNFQTVGALEASKPLTEFLDKTKDGISFTKLSSGASEGGVVVPDSMGVRADKLKEIGLTEEQYTNIMSSSFNNHSVGAQSEAQNNTLTSEEHDKLKEIGLTKSQYENIMSP